LDVWPSERVLGRGEMEGRSSRRNFLWDFTEIVRAKFLRDG
jgi:hypothetical protein